MPSTRSLPRLARSRIAVVAGALACGVLLAPAMGSAQERAPSARASQLYEDALVRFDKRDHKGAIVQLRNALRLDRKMVQSHVLLGRALLAEGEAPAAQAALEEALTLGVNLGEVALPLAQTYLQMGKLETVLSDPRFDIAKLPQQARVPLLLLKAGAASDLGRHREALKLLADVRATGADTEEVWSAEVPVRLRARQFPEAKAAADRAAALDPRSARATYQQASVAHATGDLKAALSLYDRTLSLKPDHVDALVARAGVHIDLRDADKATADVRAARQADPRDPRAAYMAALMAERAGKNAESRQALKEVTDLVDAVPLESIRFRPQVLMLGGMSHYALGQYEKSLPYLEAVLRQDPDSPVSKLLAQVYTRQKQADKAVVALEAYLRTRPNDSQALLLLASSQMALGRSGRAAQLVEDALKRGNDDPALRAVLGMSLVGAGRYEPGAAELEATLKKQPGHIPAGLSLAGLYIASGQATRAVAVAEGLVRAHPRNAALHGLLGSALAAQGEPAKARAAFTEAARLDPQLEEPALNLARLDIDEKAFDAAATRLNQILARNDKQVDAMMEVARLEYGRGRTDEALRWLKRAEDNAGPRLQPSLRLIDFHLAQGKPELAKEPLNRLQSKSPEALVVLLAQARVQLANAQLTEARSTLTRASTLMAYDAAALTEIAELQLAAGNTAGAAHALDKALAAKPGHLRARGLRSNVHLLQGEPAKAEQLARSVLASHPRAALGHGLMGDVALARNQVPAAVEHFRKAHEVEPSSSTLIRLMAALELGQRPAAVSLAQNWLRKQADDVRVLRALGDLQARAGDFAAAKGAYEGVLRLLPRDAEVLNNLAHVLVSLRDPQALKVAEQALSISPNSAHIVGTAGWAAFHAGQPDRALQLLRDARLRDPANVGTRFFLGTVLARQGRKSEAQQELQAVLSSPAGKPYAKESEALLATLR